MFISICRCTCIHRCVVYTAKGLSRDLRSCAQLRAASPQMNDTADMQAAEKKMERQRKEAFDSQDDRSSLTF